MCVTIRRAGSAATRRRRVKRGGGQASPSLEDKGNGGGSCTQKGKRCQSSPSFCALPSGGRAVLPRKSSSYPIQVSPHLLLQFVERIKPQTVIKVPLIIVMTSLNLAVVPWRQRPQKRMSDAVSAAKKS